MARAKQLLTSAQMLACLGITAAMHTTPTNAMEALIGLPLLDLVVQGEARASVHCLWSLGSWSYLHPNSGHSNILVRLQQLDPIFNMRVDVMRPAYNFDPKYTVTLLSREDWTTGTGSPPIVKGHVWFTDRSQLEGGGTGTGAGVYGQSDRRKLSLSLGQYATVFQADVFAILACLHDTEAHGLTGKHTSICSDSLAALNALEAVRTTYPLVHQCQEVLNDIPTRHAVGLYWVPGHAGVQGNETADGLARSDSASGYVRLEPALGVSLRDIRSKINRWLGNQHQR
jgi:ribonuclease HI